MFSRTSPLLETEFAQRLHVHQEHLARCPHALGHSVSVSLYPVSSLSSVRRVYALHRVAVARTEVDRNYSSLCANAHLILPRLLGSRHCTPLAEVLLLAATWLRNCQLSSLRL